MNRLCFLLTLFWVAFANNACSAILDFEEDNRPCDEQGNCIEGYSCMVNACVPNQSKEKFETCTVNEHCVHNLACVSSEFICLDTCDYPYGPGQCSDGEICVASDDSDDDLIAVCVVPDCKTICEGNETCVVVEPGAGHCMDACTVNTCTPDASGDRACQPLGADHQYACVSSGVRQHGLGCNATDTFCDADHACLMSSDGSYGFCAKYCASIDSCAGLDDPFRPAGTAAPCTPLNGASVCSSLPP